MKRQIFILEDDPNRIKLFIQWFSDKYELTIVDNVKDAISCIDGNYDVYFLDHDLGGEQMVNSNKYNTGYTLATYIVDSEIGINGSFVVHSLNPVGANNIVKMLSSNTDNRRVVVAPFGSFNETILK